MTNILYGTLYERENGKMSKKQENNKMDQGTIIAIATLIATIITIVVAIVIAIWQKTLNDATQLAVISTQLNDLIKSVDSIDNKNESLENDLERLSEKIGTIEDTNSQLIFSVANLQEDVDILKNSRYSNLEPTDYAIEKLTLSKENDYFLSNPLWKEGEVIAKNRYTKENFLIEDLEDERILLPYKENGQEVYFYGEFNEQGRWNGNCIINIYKDDKLILITDANYENGEFTEYKQVIADNDRNIWYISDRENKGDFNKGVTWSYYKNKDNDIEKGFSFETVKNTDMIDVKTFMSLNDLRVEGYYHGQTSNGKYNDLTGNSYSIKFSDDGTIRTLYVGNMVDGEYEDKTGNAWYIVKAENTDYMYYKGFFENGAPMKNDGYIFRNYLTIADIEEYISGYKFDIDLNWSKN